MVMAQKDKAQSEKATIQDPILAWILKISAFGYRNIINLDHNIKS